MTCPPRPEVNHATLEKHFSRSLYLDPLRVWSAFLIKINSRFGDFHTHFTLPGSSLIRRRHCNLTCVEFHAAGEELRKRNKWLFALWGNSHDKKFFWREPRHRKDFSPCPSWDFHFPAQFHPYFRGYFCLAWELDVHHQHAWQKDTLPPCHLQESADFVPFVCFLGTSYPERKSGNISEIHSVQISPLTVTLLTVTLRLQWQF